MPHKKLSCKKLDYLISDEKKATKEYKELGFDNLSKDEKSHANFLLKKKKEMNC